MAGDRQPAEAAARRLLAIVEEAARGAGLAVARGIYLAPPGSGLEPPRSCGGRRDAGAAQSPGATTDHAAARRTAGGRAVELTVDQASLARALQTAARVVPTKFSHPALRAVLLEAAPGPTGRLTLQATDLELAVVTAVPATVDAPGKMAVPGRLLAEYVAQLPAGGVRLTCRDEAATGRLTVTGARFAAGLATIDPLDFPALPAVGGGLILEVDAGALRQAIERVAFAVARDETRPVFRAVRFGCGPDGLTLAASDGFRLAQAFVPAKRTTAPPAHSRRWTPRRSRSSSSPPGPCPSSPVFSPAWRRRA